jgi:hypothetical protein
VVDHRGDLVVGMETTLSVVRLSPSGSVCESTAIYDPRTSCSR